MGVFNFFIVIPQLVAASILGFLVATFFMNNYVAFNRRSIYDTSGIISLTINEDSKLL
jgi:maltose/moltooligosaccharide transporter